MLQTQVWRKYRNTGALSQKRFFEQYPVLLEMRLRCILALFFLFLLLIRIKPTLNVDCCHCWTVVTVNVKKTQPGADGNGSLPTLPSPLFFFSKNFYNYIFKSPLSNPWRKQTSKQTMAIIIASKNEIPPSKALSQRICILLKAACLYIHPSVHRHLILTRVQSRWSKGEKQESTLAWSPFSHTHI